jgi:uncharacterized protein (DUF1330 family)
MTDAGVTLCAIFRIPAIGVATFQTYERAVLPLLADHGGTLQRRLRTDDGTTEVHVIRFPSASEVEAFRVDPRRQAQEGLFDASGAVAEVLTVVDAGSQ